MWILIRGLLREQRHWGDFATRFKALFPKEEILTFDIAGSGIRSHERSRLSIASMVDDLREELKKERGGAHDQELKLLGISMGGMLVSEWVHSFPSEIKQAVLINTSIRGLNPIHQRLRKSVLKDIIKIVFSSNTDKEQIIANMVSNHEVRRTDCLPLMQKIAQESPISKANAVRQLYAAASFELAEAVPRMPTLVLCSEFDRMVDFRCSKRIAELWNSSIEIHPSAGHDLVMDDPDWVLKKVGDWMMAT